MPPRHKPSKVAKFFQDFQTALNPARLFQRRARPSTPRSVYINQALPAELYDKKGKLPKTALYTSSQVVTSKYTILTFLPRNLLEQVRSLLSEGASATPLGPVGRLLSDMAEGQLGRPPSTPAQTNFSSFGSCLVSSVGSPTSSSSVRLLSRARYWRRPTTRADARTSARRAYARQPLKLTLGRTLSAIPCRYRYSPVLPQVLDDLARPRHPSAHRRPCHHRRQGWLRGCQAAPVGSQG